MKIKYSLRIFQRWQEIFSARLNFLLTFCMTLRNGHFVVFVFFLVSLSPHKAEYVLINDWTLNIINQSMCHPSWVMDAFLEEASQSYFKGMINELEISDILKINNFLFSSKEHIWSSCSVPRSIINAKEITSHREVII